MTGAALKMACPTPKVRSLVVSAPRPSLMTTWIVQVVAVSMAARVKLGLAPVPVNAPAQLDDQA